MKAILDIGVLLVTVLMVVTVGMELEAQHFRALAERKRVLMPPLPCKPLLNRLD